MGSIINHISFIYKINKKYNEELNARITDLFKVNQLFTKNHNVTKKDIIKTINHRHFDLFDERINNEMIENNQDYTDIIKQIVSNITNEKMEEILFEEEILNINNNNIWW